MKILVRNGGKEGRREEKEKHFTYTMYWTLSPSYILSDWIQYPHEVTCKETKFILHMRKLS